MSWKSSFISVIQLKLWNSCIILTSCITVWYGACNASCRKSPQRIVRAAEKIVGVSLPSLQDIYSTRLTRKAQHCRWSHPPITQLLQSAAIREETAESPGEDQQTEGQLHPSGVRKLNSLPSLPPLPSFTPPLEMVSQFGSLGYTIMGKTADRHLIYGCAIIFLFYPFRLYSLRIRIILFVWC